jgi:hypothetical protein
MGERREAKRTPVTAPDMLAAVTDAWRRYFGGEPKPEAIRILVAHWALETGWGRSMVQNNVGNVKAFDVSADYDYCYFTTWEIMARSSAEAYVKAHPKTAIITGYTNNERHARIELHPDDPGCRFKSFPTLALGCHEHLGLVHGRFSKSWPAVLSGDPVAFSHALKAQGYYTAPVEDYVRNMVAIFDMLGRMKASPTETNPIPMNVEEPFVKVPLSPELSEELLGLPRVPAE